MQQVRANAPDLSLRKGQWTAEEDAYVDKMITLFTEGLLKTEECPIGTSLQAYLAGKLYCNPSRITKKYKKMAKKVYLGFADYTSPPDEVNVQEEYERSLEKASIQLSALKDAFLTKIETDMQAQLHAALLNRPGSLLKVQAPTRQAISWKGPIQTAIVSCIVKPTESLSSAYLHQNNEIALNHKSSIGQGYSTKQFQNISHNYRFQLHENSVVKRSTKSRKSTNYTDQIETNPNHNSYMDHTSCRINSLDNSGKRYRPEYTSSVECSAVDPTSQHFEEVDDFKSSNDSKCEFSAKISHFRDFTEIGEVSDFNLDLFLDSH